MDVERENSSDVDSDGDVEEKCDREIEEDNDGRGSEGEGPKEENQRREVIPFSFFLGRTHL